MAIQDEVTIKLADGENWEGKSGKLVEDYICRKLSNLDEKTITNILYIDSSQTLLLLNKNNDIIAQGSVSVAQPEYSHSFEIKQVLINNKEVPENAQCLLGDKIQLKILYKLIAENPLTGNLNHIAGQQKLSIKLGNNNFIDIKGGIFSSDEDQLIDISEYFTDTTVGTITLRVSTSVSGVSEENKILSASTKSISVLNPKLSYVGNNYIVNGNVSFQILKGGNISYLLKYKLNGNNTLYTGETDNFNINLDTPGVNKIEVYAVVFNNELIKTQTLNIQIINIANLDVFDSLQVAVNEISNTISNWEYSKMYRISLYTKGISDKYININTKLTNTADNLDLYFDKTKLLETDLINTNNLNPYCYEEDVCYFFGINSLTLAITSNLVINVNNLDILSFDDFILIKINTDSAFTYTEGTSFYYDQFNPDNSNIITKDVLTNIESPDGIIQEDSLTVFRVSANEYSTPVLKQDLSNVLTNSGLTFELDFKSYNISDPKKPVLKLGKFILYPTELNWQFSENNENIDKTSRSSLFQEDERTHIIIQIAPNFKAPLREIPTQVLTLSGKSINLVRIFINGVVDREFKYDTLSDFNLNGFNLEIAPEASDIDIYNLRVYNRALSLEEISSNYISTMSNINEKKFFQKANAIVATDSNNDTYISYALAKQLYNTIVYIVPKGNQYLHQFSATKNTKIQDCTVFVNYVNNEKLPTLLSEKQIAKSSGRFTGVELKGLGTSAMKYYWYNTSMKGKFTSQGCYDLIEQSYVEPAEGQDLLYNSIYYYMPTDPNIGIKKLVGKTNYASSMQSHKIGATKAFHDLWMACVDKSSFTELDLMGRKAVLEEPFLAFYIESDIESTWVKDTNEDAKDSPMKQITPEYLETIDDSLIRFAGFQTWGSGKGDDASSGYDEDVTPGYLMLEGAENDGKLTNFLTPWMPECIKLSGETYKTLGLIADGLGGTSYGTFDSFDVDFGLAEDSETELCEAAKKTMEKFIEAYNFVYMHTINLEPYTGTTSLNSEENKTLLDVTKKYYITNSRYSDPTGFTGYQWDVFRYDQYSAMWVPAGLPIFNAEGKQSIHETIKSSYGTDVYDYEVFNLKTFYETNGGTGAEKIDNFKQLLIDKFKEGFGEYFHVDDIVFHQAFIKLFAGTDNRAKNTYFKLIDGNGKISLLQDDLDTILATDNRGLQKKPYFLLEPSQESNPEYQGMWGGNSAFFEVFDVAYKEEINQMLKRILTQFEVNQEPSIHNWMLKYFYYVQEYFPATAYNHTARLCYESAQIFFDNQGSVGITWQNNGLDPVSQVHGSCLLSEKEFMKKRLIMFLSQAQVSNIFGKEGMGINIKASEDAGSSGVGTYTIDITPYQYLYLGYNSGSNPNLYSKERQAAEVPFTATITIDSTTPLYSVLGARYIKKFEDFSKILWKSGTYNLSAKRLVEMSAKASEGETSNFLPPMINLETPVLTKLDLTGVSSLTTINLDSDHTPKLLEVYLTGTSITDINLPTGSRLKTIHFPKTLLNLHIYNNPGLQEVIFESYDNLKTIYIDGEKCGNFNIADFCESIIDSPLESVTLKNVNISITEEAFMNLIIGTDFLITGTITLLESKNSTELKAISFNTKQTLVNTFGDIDNGENNGINDLIIKYKSVEISEIKYPDEVNAYYDQTIGGTLSFSNLFTLDITGNNVDIKEGKNPFNEKLDHYLDISYSFIDKDSNVYFSEDNSGTLNIKGVPTSTVSVKVTINGEGGPYYNETGIIINFLWYAPEIGEFAYVDGTFSKNYNSSKNLVGLVFDKSGDNNSGTVYIISKDYSNISEWASYLTEEGRNEGTIDKFSELTLFITSIKSQFNLESLSPSGFTTYSLTDNITKDHSTVINSLLYPTINETKLYVDFVNTKILPKLISLDARFDKYITNKGNNQYEISSINDLNSICTLLNTHNFVTSQSYKYMNAALVFPYFYSAYLYEPENASGTFYEKNNWYAPSYAEMAKIIYLCGYSSRLDSFSDRTHVFEEATILSNDINNYYKDNLVSTPVFALAKTKMSTNYPETWKTILNINNSLITTNNASDYNCNYGYVKITYWDSNNTISLGMWQSGLYQNWLYYNLAENLWAYTPRKGGLVFTSVSYKNPQLS